MSPSAHTVARDALLHHARDLGLYAHSEVWVMQPPRRPLRVDLYVYGCDHDPALAVEYKGRLINRSELRRAVTQVARYAFMLAEQFGQYVEPLIVCSRIETAVAGDPVLTPDQFRALLAERCSARECSPLLAALNTLGIEPERAA